jgi:hypothetical protein
LWRQNSLFECLGANHLFVTNWAGVTKHLSLPGCVATLHLPLLDVTAGQRGTAIIFSPRPGKGLAVLVADRNERALKRLIKGISGQSEDS